MPHNQRIFFDSMLIARFDEYRDGDRWNAETKFTKLGKHA